MAARPARTSERTRDELTQSTVVVEHRARMLPASVPVDLTWNAPAECPSRDAVLDEVARVLAARKPGAPATARADVTRDGRGRWHATLSVGSREARSERILEAESCPAIASAAAVIIAVAVEGDRPEASPPVAAQSTFHPPASAATAPEPKPAWQLVVRAGGVLDGGMLPSVAPGGEAAVGCAFEWSRLRIRALASASLFTEQTASVRNPVGDGTGTEGGTFGPPFVASVSACASAVQARLDLGLCLGAELDVVRATGFATGAARLSFINSSPQTRAWVSALGSVLASWSLSRHIAFFIRGDGLVSPGSPTFGLLPRDIRVHQPYPSSLGARGALGIEARFF
jgi:hypothetical protein